jgi:hypothetical protein
MKYLKRISLIAVAGFLFVTSCKNSDSKPELPTISLAQESIKSKAGESISMTVTYTTPEGFDHLDIAKKIDGEVKDTKSVTEDGSGSYNFEYDILVDDSDGILSFTFTIYDKADASASKDLVVEVELTKKQLLNKYDWLLSDEIRNKTGESDITDAYTDDVYRFHADGTYDKSIGEKKDSFGDSWFNYCYWNLDDQDVLIMTKTGAFGEDVRDTLYITTLNSDEMKADVTYYGLDAFNTGEEATPYEPREEYVKVFAAQPKGANYDPYGPGSDDDGGPAGTCNEVTF